MRRARLNPNEILEKLSSIKGARIIGLTTIVEPEMRKTANPYFGQVLKVSRFSAMINFDYDTGVLKRLAKEGKDPASFTRGQSWHEAILTPEGKLTAFSRHKTTGEVYLRLVRLSGASRFIDKRGRFMAKRHLEPFLKDSGRYNNQGLNNPLVFITPKLSNVVSLRGV